MKGNFYNPKNVEYIFVVNKKGKVQNINIFSENNHPTYPKITIITKLSDGAIFHLKNKAKLERDSVADNYLFTKH